jgi:hypothetical protein
VQPVIRTEFILKAMKMSEVVSTPQRRIGVTHSFATLLLVIFAIGIFEKSRNEWACSPLTFCGFFTFLVKKFNLR